MRSNLLKPAALFLSLLIVASLIACTKAEPSAQPNAPPQNAATPGSSGSRPGTTPPAAIASPAETAATVSGSGTITAATYANLNFGTAGKIEEISVKQGDRVSKGTVLARLDTRSLEVALAQARVALNQAELARIQAKTNLATAQFTRDKTTAVSDINDRIIRLQWELKRAEMWMQDPANTTYRPQQIATIQQSLADERAHLSALLGQSEDTDELAKVAQEYDSVIIDDARAKQLQVELAQQTLDKSQDAIDQAQESLALAQKQLDEATITAPFDGIVAALNYDEGDFVPAPSQIQRPIIYMIDPAAMELNIGVNELDVPRVMIGQRASISIAAFPDAKLEGKVAAISPTPTVQGGIVDYDVTVSFSVPPGMEVRVDMNAAAQIIVKSQATSELSPVTQPGSSGSRPGSTPPAAITSPAETAATVSGSGTITAATYANLNFGTAGKIEEISVKQGDRVSKGTVLARLDTRSLEVALAQAKVASNQAELARIQAETNLATAQFTRDKTKAVSDIKEDITNIRWKTFFMLPLGISEGGMADLASKIQDLSDLLDKPEYADVLTYDILEEKYDTLTVENIRIKQLQVELAQQTLDKSQDTIDQSQKSLALAQKQLDEATVTAPFDGIVAALNYSEGDFVPAPSQIQRPIIYMIDPATMELNIGVNELDVPRVMIGQRASISIDAFPDAKLEGKVAAISPMPTVQGGIVDYKVTVTFSIPSDIEVRVGMNATAQIVVK